MGGKGTLKSSSSSIENDLKPAYCGNSRFGVRFSSNCYGALRSKENLLMPAGNFPLLFGPFGQYRHGCDPPGQLAGFCSLPTAFDQSNLPRGFPAGLFAFSFISQRLRVLEPFIHPLRHTSIPRKSPEPTNWRIGKERNQ